MTSKRAVHTRRGTYVIALDQGTTSSRAVLVDAKAQVIDVVQRPFTQIFPQPGWVEHNPHEILMSQLGALTELISKNNLAADDIDCIGIDNQRETTIVWDPETGQPIYNAIVWQDRRTADHVKEVTSPIKTYQYINQVTGLIPDAYFSASKIEWILDNVPGARERAEKGELLFGTVDTWLLWVLTGGLVHATDETNAARTMLFDIHRGCWDKGLLELFNIPYRVLPHVFRSSWHFGETSYPGLPAGIPITGVAGDQQAALFGHLCLKAGEAKNTYGTGCFMLTHTGPNSKKSVNGLVTTIAARPPSEDKIQFALEGSVFVAGALIQWLRDELGIVHTAAETELLARSVDDSAGVHVIPALTGMGAPWWKPDARGAILGLTRGTSRAHIARAALEAIAYQIRDLADAMEMDAGKPLELLMVDGGASENNFLMEFQADLLGCKIKRPANTEVTSLGAAFLAGLCTGFWEDETDLYQLRGEVSSFTPRIEHEQAEQLVHDWHRAVMRVM